MKLDKKQMLSITLEPGESIEIRGKGFGTLDATRGHGYPIWVEHYEGTLLVHVWPDINNQEPTTIDLKGAHDSHFKEV